MIDDGSVDDTAAIARRHGAAVVTLPYNIGIGGAVQTGFKYALERGYADGGAARRRRPARSRASSQKLLGPIERGEADIVTGSRFVEGPATTGRRSPGGSGSSGSPRSSRC